MSKSRKKPPNTKRVDIPRQCSYTKEFSKAWERYKRAGRHDLHAMQEVMSLLFLGKKLPEKYRDHGLEGDWGGHRELHVEGDFLLIYKTNEQKNLLIFTAMGTHSELFG